MLFRSWAFAAMGVVEAMKSIKDSTATGVYVAPVRLSEQEQVDCTSNTTANVAMFGKSYGNSGCSGGWMTNAWNFSRDWGMMTNADYAYTAVNGTCKYDRTKALLKTGLYGTVTSATALTRLAKGPMSIAVAAGNSVWRYYRSGFLTSADLCPTALDHGVMLVGYDTAPIGTVTCRDATSAEKTAAKCADGTTYNSTTGRCCKAPSTVAQPVWLI